MKLLLCLLVASISSPWCDALPQDVSLLPMLNGFHSPQIFPIPANRWEGNQGLTDFGYSPASQVNYPPINGFNEFAKLPNVDILSPNLQEREISNEVNPGVNPGSLNAHNIEYAIEVNSQDIPNTFMFDAHHLHNGIREATSTIVPDFPFHNTNSFPVPFAPEFIDFLGSRAPPFPFSYIPEFSVPGSPPSLDIPNNPGFSSVGIPDYLTQKGSMFPKSNIPEFQVPNSPEFQFDTVRRFPGHSIDEFLPSPPSNMPEFSFSNSHGFPNAPAVPATDFGFPIPNTQESAVPNMPHFLFSKEPEFAFTPALPFMNVPEVLMPRTSEFMMPNVPDFTVPSSPEFMAPGFPNFQVPNVPENAAPIVPEFVIPGGPIPSVPYFAVPHIPDFTGLPFPEFPAPYVPQSAMQNAYATQIGEAVRSWEQLPLLDLELQKTHYTPRSPLVTSFSFNPFAINNPVPPVTVNPFVSNNQSPAPLNPFVNSNQLPLTTFMTNNQSPIPFTATNQSPNSFMVNSHSPQITDTFAPPMNPFILQQMQGFPPLYGVPFIPETGNTVTSQADGTSEVTELPLATTGHVSDISNQQLLNEEMEGFRDHNPVLVGSPVTPDGTEGTVKDFEFDGTYNALEQPFPNYH